MEKIIKFGIIGCGSAASTHARLLAEIENAQLVGITDKRQESASAFAEKYGAKVYESYEKMLADPEIDVITVTTPSYFHKENAIAALDAGKHVVLEKPMALDTEGCDEIIKHINSSGKLLTSIFMMRFSDDVTKVKSMVENGELGKITLAALEMNYYRSPEYFSLSDWRGTLKYDGGGALINQGIHGIDLLLYILGDVTEVKAMKNTAVHKIEAEDTLGAIMRFESGAIATVTASTCINPGFDRVIKIFGERGYVVLEENEITELMVDGKAAEIEKKLNYATANTNAVADVCFHRKQVENFIGAILGQGEIAVTAEDGKRAVRVIRAIYDSADEK